MSRPFTRAALYATPAQLALAPRYSTLDGALADIQPGQVVRNTSGEVRAGHADMLRWLTPENVGGTK